MVDGLELDTTDNAVDPADAWRTRLDDWAEEARLVVRGLEVAAMAFPSHELRRWPRTVYRFHTILHLFGGSFDYRDWGVYTRDISIWGAGFVTRQTVPAGEDGWILLPERSSKSRRIEGTVIRCREFLNGWYEGAILFAREQSRFAPEQIDAERDDQENAEDWFGPPEHFLG